MLVRSRNLMRVGLSALLLIAFTACSYSQKPSTRPQRLPARAAGSSAGPTSDRSFPALFISDIHFDPFHDPGKAKQLAAAPVSEWRSILGSVNSPDQMQAFAALQKQYNARGVDTPITLLQSSLTAMKAQQPDSKFIMLGGDLVVHGFKCRYSVLFPDASAQDFQTFVLKIMSYVMDELKAALPGIPIYTALGNNDSGCGDYELDADGDFLSKAGDIVASALPTVHREVVSREFTAEGDYSVMMPAPMKNTRLVVLNDTFLSPGYRTCAGKPDSKGAEEETAWFRTQLLQARQLRQRVWVMGHIPPGVDPYSTVLRFKNVCGGDAPVMFLSSDKIPDLMVEYGDVVKLGIFAHTHMDEVRLLQPRSGGSGDKPEQSVAVKVIPSISPVHGNRPSFTVARIDPVSAALQEYTVVMASNETGNHATWTSEYSFDRTYRQTEFSAKALKGIIGKFHADNAAVVPESGSYLRDYFPGDRAAALSLFWKQYVCVLNNYTARAYAACVCRAGN